NLLCRTPPATWAELIAPSKARLTAQAPAAVTPAPGPCVITPVGGYTGLENRLYRVEVHQGGTLGGGGGTQKVQFKWSRDNAAARHPRVRRWDRDPLAVVPEPPLRDWNGGAAIALENGIVITFGGAATDTLHAGDYWVFAARTATGEIDPLVNAPPRGVLHHF